MNLDCIDSLIEYKSSFEQGKSISQRWFDVGWVELLKRSGRVYYCKHPTPDCYKNLMQAGRDRLISLVNADKIKDSNNLKKDLQQYNRDLGLAIHLANERLQGPFMLPCMGNIKNNHLSIGTGTSRICADLMCATPPEEISFIIFVAAGDQVNMKEFFHQHTELNSSAEYESLLGIEDIDYRINFIMNKSGEYEFTNSIIAHSIYDYSTAEESINFANLGKNFLYQTKSCSNEEKQIRIEIRCSEEVVKFIPGSNEKYKINIETRPSEEWSWSYGRFLSLTNSREIQQAAPAIYLLVYDISEMLDLDLALLWLGNSLAYQTRNKKLAAFTPGKVGSIKEVGNFVK